MCALLASVATAASGDTDARNARNEFRIRAENRGSQPGAVRGVNRWTRKFTVQRPGKVHMSKIVVDCGADEHVCPQQFVAGAPLGLVRGGLLYDAQV